MRFFLGMHHPSDAWRAPAFVSVRALRKRRAVFRPGEWILDSGAFTELAQYGEYRCSVRNYAAEIKRWSACGRCLAAVAQDYMCEPFMLEKTGLTVAEHQRLTIERYDELLRHDTGPVYIMPVLQGYAPEDYVSHIRQYGERLSFGAWVGVGSVCKRNAKVDSVLGVLRSIKADRPDLRLHGFGLKTTALANAEVRSLLHSADSMAWSLAARLEGRDGNDINEGLRFAARINEIIAA